MHMESINLITVFLQPELNKAVFLINGLVVQWIV